MSRFQHWMLCRSKNCLKEQIPLLTQCEKDIQDLIELLHAKRQQVKRIKQGIRACKRALELSEGNDHFYASNRNLASYLPPFATHQAVGML
jgi:hypothetical protein